MEVGFTWTARITLVATDNGGGQNAMGSGYRSLLRPRAAEQTWGFQFEFDGPSIEPGEARTGRVSTWADRWERASPSMS